MFSSVFLEGDGNYRGFIKSYLLAVKEAHKRTRYQPHIHHRRPGVGGTFSAANKKGRL